MIDGVSGVQVLELLTDGASTNGTSQATSRPAAPDAGATGWLAAAVDAVTHPSRLLARVQEAVAAGGALAGFTLRPGDAFPWNGPLGATRAVRWQHFDLDRLFAMRAASGCKINDVALAVIAGALRAVLPAEVTAGRRARALVPVNVRTTADYLALGNRISGRFASLPLDVADPRERLRLVAEDMRGQKAAGAVQAFDVALAIANTLPSAVGPRLARLNSPWPVVHTVCTNVPGPSERRRLAGVTVEAVHPIVPLAVGIGLGFAMLSYAGSLSITVTADPALVPAIDRLPTALANAAEELATSLGLPPVGAAAGPAPRVLTVGELMSHPVVTVAPDARLGAAWHQMRAHRIRHLPVVDGAGILRGLVTHRDLLTAFPSPLGTQRGSATSMLAFGWTEVRDVMETHVSTTTADESAARAGQRMSRQKIGCLLVVGARGELVGIVTEQDFLRWAVEHMAA
jgi:CBS domain-containing protein